MRPKIFDSPKVQVGEGCLKWSNPLCLTRMMEETTAGIIQRVDEEVQ